MLKLIAFVYIDSMNSGLTPYLYKGIWALSDAIQPLEWGDSQKRSGRWNRRAV